jgi:predicted molibdopterin-dependent oxidoreductase YjgC
VLAEQDGCYVNRDGRVQRFTAARTPNGNVRATWQILSDLAAKLERGVPAASAGDAFTAVAEKVRSFQGLSYEKIGMSGATIPERTGTGGGV